MSKGLPRVLPHTKSIILRGVDKICNSLETSVAVCALLRFERTISLTFDVFKK